MPRKTKKRKSSKDDSKLFAFIVTFFSILGFIIALLGKRDDKYVMFYAKQSLIVFLAYIIAVIIGVLPGIGKILGVVASVLVFILWIYSWVYALGDKEKGVPLIGEYASHINL